MYIKSIGINFIFTLILILTLIGCTSPTEESTSDSSKPTILEGTFIDAPVYGLYYKTSTQSGYTNSLGKFKYIPGESVEFKLGNISLGSVTASKVITPYIMAGDTNTSKPSAKATNIAMLLQSFDGNRSNTIILDLTKLKNFNFENIDLSIDTSDMTTKISNMFADNDFTTYRDALNNTPVDATSANHAMKTFVDAEIIKVNIAEGTSDKIAILMDKNTIYQISDLQDKTFFIFYPDAKDINKSEYSKLLISSDITNLSNNEDYIISNGNWIINNTTDDTTEIIEIINNGTIAQITYSNGDISYMSIKEKTDEYWVIRHAGIIDNDFSIITSKLYKAKTNGMNNIDDIDFNNKSLTIHLKMNYQYTSLGHADYYAVPVYIDNGTVAKVCTDGKKLETLSGDHLQEATSGAIYYNYLEDNICIDFNYKDSTLEGIDNYTLDLSQI